MPPSNYVNQVVFGSGSYFIYFVNIATVDWIRIFVYLFVFQQHSLFVIDDLSLSFPEFYVFNK